MSLVIAYLIRPMSHSPPYQVDESVLKWSWPYHISNIPMSSASWLPLSDLSEPGHGPTTPLVSVCADFLHMSEGFRQSGGRTAANVLPPTHLVVVDSVCVLTIQFTVYTCPYVCTVYTCPYVCTVYPCDAYTEYGYATGWASHMCCIHMKAGAYRGT